MANCKCKSKPRIVSNVVKAMNGNCCIDVCTTPICGEPDKLTLMAPLIYDEIGINLCASFQAGVDIPTAYPTATSATIRAINATFTNGAGNVLVQSISGRPNCYEVTLSNITVLFELRLYDSACRLVATVFPTAVYLPSTTTVETYDEDTNPTSVVLEVFAPYGISYDTTGATPTAVVNYTGFATTNNFVQQGINLYSRAKLLDIDISTSTITVGLTFILQSLYFAGYKVDSCGRLDTPKGSIISPENSDCMRFVAGNLLDLEIKPLDLGNPNNEQCLKKERTVSCGSCINENSNYNLNSNCGICSSNGTCNSNGISSHNNGICNSNETCSNNGTCNSNGTCDNSGTCNSSGTCSSNGICNNNCTNG